MEYNPSRIEAHWKKFWTENQTYKVANGGTKPKFYILNMFPYPSGAGLHVGHPLGYIATDIYARYKRLKGFNVLNPMGYDSFGLPAEQYAIQTGTHPALTTEKNIATFRGQLDNLGFSFDWSREVRTSDPAYYKWTQWIFMQLFNHYYDKNADKPLTINELTTRLSKEGNAQINAVCDEDTPIISAADWNGMSEKDQQLFLLKYRLTFPEESFVNWCKALGTVLSNDEVKDGVSERGGYPVERKLMKQWSMRITAYADKLLAGLDTVDWSDSLKEQQRNWIGRSQGASVKFPLALDPEVLIEVFTTRVDTIYGVSFMVLAPEHELVAHLTTKEQKSDIENYQKWAASRSDVERMSEVKKVSGAFTGSYCVNPFNGEKIQIWIADYVLAGYGTGAVMGVPSGDQRDWNFATHFNLPIVQILDNQKDIHIQADNTKEGKYINSGIINGLEYKEATAKLINWLEEKGLGKGKIQYRLRNAIFSRQRYWGEPVPAYWKDGVPYLIDESELPLVLPSIEKYLPTETGEPPLGRAEGWKYKGEYEYELSTMPGWAGSSWYFYRYMDTANTSEFASKEALDYWQNVDIYVGGTEHAVGHLLYSRFWNHFMYDLGLIPQKEYAAKLINQGMIQGRSKFIYRLKSNENLKEYLKECLINNGFEIRYKNIQAHGTTWDFVITKDSSHLFAISVSDGSAPYNTDFSKVVEEMANLDISYRHVTYNYIAKNYSNPSYLIESLTVAQGNLILPFDTVKTNLFLNIKQYKKNSAIFTPIHVPVEYVDDSGYLDIEKIREWRPVEFLDAEFELENGKYLCGEEVEKMSKSKYNVVNPDEMVTQYGADCFRMYEMFLGPLEDSKPWSTTGITGVQGFLRKLWSLFYDLNTGKNMLQEGEPTKEEYKALHKCIKKVSEDIERFSFNTCVSSFMICANELKDLKCHKPLILKELVTMVAPFAPFVAEELNSFLGNEKSVLENTFPTLNESYLVESSIVYPISINGKKRGEATFSADAKPADIEAEVRAMEVVRKWTEDDGKDIKKVIIVPGRMVNIVV
jgi:leucyl-tRNA synthetase